MPTKKTSLKKTKSKKSSPAKKTKSKKSPMNSTSASAESNDEKTQYEEDLAEMRKSLEGYEEKDKDDLGGYTFNDIDSNEEDATVVEYNQLSELEERRKIKKNMAKAHAYLEKLGIEELEIDSLNHIIVVPFEYEDFQFLSHIIVGVDWFMVKASILEIDETIEALEPTLFFELLKGNFMLNDVTYSVDPEKKSVWCEADIPTDTDFEHFRLQYLSIVFAIDYFIKNISHDIKRPIESTYHQDRSDNNLYI